MEDDPSEGVERTEAGVQGGGEIKSDEHYNEQNNDTGFKDAIVAPFKMLTGPTIPASGSLLRQSSSPVPSTRSHSGHSWTPTMLGMRRSKSFTPNRTKSPIIRVASSPSFQNALNTKLGQFGLAPAREVRRQLEEELAEPHAYREPFTQLSSMVSYARSAANVIYKDDFSLVFKRHNERDWNWGHLLIPWLIGCCFRYLILLPLRLSILIIIIIWSTLHIGIASCLCSGRRLRDHKLWVVMYIKTALVFWCFGGVIRIHGILPKKKANQIYVANHSSMIDFAVFGLIAPAAAVGQQHQTTFLRFMQNFLFAGNGIWFNRKEVEEKKAVIERIKQFISDPTNPRLIIFPEGTCVNNEYCIQFKQGAFTCTDEICPVAIKYNKTISDPYWISRKRSFFMYLCRLMSNWALVCDIYFMDLVTRDQSVNETPIEFANRVKKMIADKANLKNVPWDGYMKHYEPSERAIRAKRKLLANDLRDLIQKRTNEQRRA